MKKLLAILLAFLDWRLKGLAPAVPLSEMSLPKGDGTGSANAHFGLGGMPPIPKPPGRKPRR